MSGKTARRARAKLGKKKAQRLVTYDTKRIFADIMLELMNEYGINQANCTNEEIMKTIAMCSDVYMETYDDYLCEVLYGGDMSAVETDLMFLGTVGTAPILFGE